MFTQLFVLAAISVQLASADRLSTWLSDMCTNANQGNTEPLPLGECIEFGQAQSYILNKDDGKTYNLFTGGGCHQYVGQVSLSGTCLATGDATGIMNIGHQDAKRWIRGANPLGKRTKRRSSLRSTNNARTLERRVEGDTYQCPNVPSGADYFFVVQTSSAAHEETFPDEDRIIRNDFVGAFNTAYQNPSGQTQVTSFSPEPDVQMTLTMNQGVIQDIHPVDIENLTNNLFQFRNRETNPVNFIVGLYTGRIDHPDAGLIAEFHWQGD
ncbi:hypothetical protein DFP72DRAFT_1075780 [Ephemerocybe angulata]|uniref:Uncharacterized protein n=1 Tax=Ephemerocybe angulata TaxID=980116 RepID=A0A8H6HJJ5_9AGAR|nr:hypothetical protein DFP72DRAFT_1075780 [Tulosesus angulatus]